MPISTRASDMYLIDTNVISEARKGSNTNAGVKAFWKSVNGNDLYIPVQTIGEIRRGISNIALRGDKEQSGKLEAWLEMIVTDFADRILSFDEACAQVWGNLMSPNPQHSIDKQIAAIALIYNLTVVTRNVNDFEGTGVNLLNPFVI